jgi:hypothetical protein
MSKLIQRPVAGRAPSKSHLGTAFGYCGHLTGFQPVERASDAKISSASVINWRGSG